MADGGIIMPPYDMFVSMPSQKAVIVWDGETEELTLSTKISADAIADVAWIIPLPSSTQPEVEEGSIEIFYALADMFMVKSAQNMDFGMAETASPRSGVEVVEEKTVDIYDITVLKATSGNDLAFWLAQHGYSTPSIAIPVFQHYADQGNFYFIANRINLKEKYGIEEVSAVDKACADFLQPQVQWIFYDPHAPPMEEMVPDLMYGEEECDGASEVAVTALAELSNGIATPLKITFTPEAPFYPMFMSSINEGETIVDVYVFSSTPMKDSAGVLWVEGVEDVPSWFGSDYGIDAEYVSLLSYYGELSELSVDSVFVEADIALDPRNRDEGYGDMWAWFVGLFFMLILFFLVATPIFVLLLFRDNIKNLFKKK